MQYPVAQIINSFDHFVYPFLFRFRYTLRELPKILADLKKRADSFDNWEIAVHKALSKTDATKIGKLMGFCCRISLGLLSQML